jgi:hypothetical protein
MGRGTGISPDQWDRLVLLHVVGSALRIRSLGLLLFFLTSIVHLLSGEIHLTPRIRDRPRLFLCGRVLLCGRFANGELGVWLVAGLALTGWLLGAVTFHLGIDPDRGVHGRRVFKRGTDLAPSHGSGETRVVSLT